MNSTGLNVTQNNARYRRLRIVFFSKPKITRYDTLSRVRNITFNKTIR